MSDLFEALTAVSASVAELSAACKARGRYDIAKDLLSAEIGLLKAQITESEHLAATSSE